MSEWVGESVGDIEGESEEKEWVYLCLCMFDVE